MVENDYSSFTDDRIDHWPVESGCLVVMNVANKYCLIKFPKKTPGKRSTSEGGGPYKTLSVSLDDNSDDSIIARAWRMIRIDTIGRTWINVKSSKVRRNKRGVTAGRKCFNKNNILGALFFRTRILLITNGYALPRMHHMNAAVAL